MGLKDVVAISRKNISVSGVAYKLDGTSYSYTANTYLENWFNIIILDDGGSGTIDYKKEFTTFTLAHTLEIVNQSLADALGLDTGVVYSAGGFDATGWGSSKLVLQNAEKDKGKLNSILNKFEQIEWDFENNTEILRGFAPESNYDKDNDRNVYQADIVYFAGTKRQYVKDFFHENGRGTAEELRIYGLEFKISNTQDLNLVMSIYKGFKEQYSNLDLKRWSIGFIEKV